MIADKFRQNRGEVENALDQLLCLSTQLKREPATLNSLHELITQVREPLLLVAIGEAKTGKSSLLNALLGESLAKTTTDQFCLYQYGAAEKSVELLPRLTHRYLPLPFLQDINVLDTPATSAPDDHWMLEAFLPRADVVLFVLSATNPWSESTWQSLHVVQNFGLKNVVFVLQQSDLRDATQLDVIRRHLEDTAARKLGSVVALFPVSAEKALLAAKHNLIREELWQESGFGPLTNHINGIVAESGSRFSKLQAIAAKGATIANDVADELRRAADTIDRDEKHLERVRQFLDVRKEDSLRAVPGFFRNMDQGTENAVQLFEAELRNVWTKLQDAIEAGFSATAKSRISATTPNFVGLRPRSNEHAAVEQQMKDSVHRFYHEIAVAFEPLAAFCIAERKRYEPLVEQAGSVKEALSELSRRLGA